MKASDHQAAGYAITRASRLNEIRTVFEGNPAIAINASGKVKNNYMTIRATDIRESPNTDLRLNETEIEIINAVLMSALKRAEAENSAKLAELDVQL